MRAEYEDGNEPGKGKQLSEGCDDNDAAAAAAAADSRSKRNRESVSTRRRMNETKSGGDSNDSPSPSTPRRRTHFNARQLSVLDGRFCQCPHVSYFERLQLGRDLGITERQVKVWFQNRRTKERRKTAAAKGDGRSRAGDRPERFVQSRNADDNESASVTS